MSRETKERVSVRKELEKLQDVQRGVATRLDQLNLTPVEPDYVSMDEEAYATHCAQKRLEDEAFFVDDDRIEHLEQRSRKKRLIKKRPSEETKGHRDKKPALENVEKETHANASKTRPKETFDTSSDDLLSEILTNIRMSSINGSNKDDTSHNSETSVLPENNETAFAKDASNKEEKESNGERLELPEAFTDDPPSVVSNGVEVERMEENMVPFFFIDAEEGIDNAAVYLFGKVAMATGGSKSCCVRFRSLERVLYFIPRPGIIHLDERLTEMKKKAEEDAEQRKAFMECLEEMASSFKMEVGGILKHRGVRGEIRMKMVQRSYAFDVPSLPHGQHYVLKVTFLAKGNISLFELKGNTFQMAMATRQSLLESVLLRRKIMGPTWLALKEPKPFSKSFQRSWCEVEFEVESHKYLLVSHRDLVNRPPPKLNVAALQFKSVHNPKFNGHEILMATIVSLSNIKCDQPMVESEWNRKGSLQHFHAIGKFQKQPWPPGFEMDVSMKNGDSRHGEIIALHDSEHALLTGFVKKIQDLDPDVLVGHNISNVDLNLLLHRMQNNKISDWSRIGRLKRSRFPSFSRGGSISAVTGRLLCDTFVSAHEFLREVDFSLTTLARTLFDTTRSEITFEDMTDAYSNKKKLADVLDHSLSDAILTVRIMFHLSVLPLTKQLTNLSGSLWNRTFQGHKAQRTDMLLLHEFHNRKFLLPESGSSNDRSRSDIDHPERKSGPQYAGGLVLEPKKGLYDKMVLLLDFNSLYPSIIMEFKLCFTTVDRSGPQAILPGSEAPFDAPLPTVIHGLIESRRKVKQLIASEKNPLLLQQRKTREQALKLTANSMYGCLGFQHSRFYCKPLAELITSQGRNILQKTVDKVEQQLNYEVVYGDTDSIMVNTNHHDFETVRREMAEKIKKVINKDYRFLRIDVDGIFQPLLLLKKKKYAAMKISFKEGKLVKQREDKGLDTVRRDWSKLAKNAGNCILEEILSGKPTERVVTSIHQHLVEVQTRIASGTVPLSEFEIVKELAKHPEGYADARVQPHVQVALRRKQQGFKDGVQQGQAVPYAICITEGDSGQHSSLAQRAFHPDEVRRDPERLKVDTRYYLEYQVLPLVSRLCEPIEGISMRSLAESLGLDGTKYRSSNYPRHRISIQNQPTEPELEGTPLSLKLGEQPFTFCGVQSIVDGQISMEDALKPKDAILASGSEFKTGQFANQVTLQARRCIMAYYDAACKIEEDEESKTRIPRYAESEGNPKWLREISERQLYQQLTVFVKQLDVDAAISKIKAPEKKQALISKYESLKNFLQGGLTAVRDLRNLCEFGTINFSSLFGSD